MHIYGLLFLLPFLLSDLPLALAKWRDDVSHRGKHFVITFAQVFYDNNFQPLVLISTDQEGATVKIWMPRLSFDQRVTIPPYSSSEVPLPIESRSFENGIGDNAVVIEADTEVTVVGINRVDAYNDAYLALPTPVLGLDHYAVTWDFLPFINVAAVYNETTLTVTFPINAKFKPFTHMGNTYAPGATLRVHLEAYQTYQIFSKEIFVSEDLTGTRIESDRPVAVYSGSLTSKVLGKVPMEYHHLNDHLEEQLFPVNLWGQDFIMIHAPRRAVSSLLRVVASEDETTVELKGKESYQLMKAGDFLDVDIDRDRNFYEVLATKPIQVVTIEKSRLVGETDVNPDPSMCTLIPTNFFSQNLTLRPLDELTVTRFEVFIIIIARSIDIGTIRINGLPLENQNWTAVQESPFMVTELKLEQQTYYLDSSNPHATFTAYVYGFRFEESYTFPTGFIFPYDKVCHKGRPGDWPGVDNDCDGIPDRLPPDECKGWACAQHAMCIDGQCECQPPYYGAGRFACGNRDEECVCSAFGDPHTVDFSGAKLEMPLQCRHLLAEVALPDCNVRVYVRGRAFGTNPLLSMLDTVEWNYGHPLAVPLRGVSMPTGTYFSSGRKVPFNTRVSSNSTDVVFRVDEDYFYSIDSKCDVELRYRNPVVTVRRPVPLGQMGQMSWGMGRGLCGECTENATQPAPPSPLLRVLLSIDEVDENTSPSPIFAPSSPFPLASPCALMETAIQTCPAARREAVVRQCSRLLDPAGPVSTCKVRIPTQDLYSAIALCLQRACKRDPTFEATFAVLAAC